MTQAAADMRDSLVLSARPHPLRQGLDAARANFVPGVGLWAIGTAILLGYYYHPPTTALLERVAEVQRQAGVLFAFASTAIAGGVIPVLVQHALRMPGREPLRALPVLLLFWGERGVEVYYLYKFQDWFWGTGTSPGVLIPKMLSDQLIYSAFWAVPTLVLFYIWRDAGYRLGETRRRLGPNWIRERVIPVTLSNWAVWFPMVAILYSLPVALQVPMASLVLCLWVLMVMFLTRRGGEPAAV